MKRGRGKSLRERIFPLGIPLAWLQLTSEGKRFAVAIAGITFAVTMMLFQIGLRGALFRQAVAPMSLLDCDVVLVSPNYEYFGVGRGFPQARLHQARAVDGVKEVSGLKLGCMSFKNPDSGRERDIFVIAFDPSKDVFLSDDIKAGAPLLKENGAVLFDVLSRGQYGDVEGAFLRDGYVNTELANRKARVAALIKIGATFAAEGNVLMSLSTFDSIWPNAAKNVYNVGLIKLENPDDAALVRDRLKEIYPPDTVVMTGGEFIDKEKEYWAVRTPIGFVIGASMAVAIFVGAVIVYQILYTDVSDHIPEYATLKAIGFDDRFFIWIVMQESAILSVLGFIPGTLLAAGLYKLTRDVANMPTRLEFVNLLIVFTMSVGMCMVAGLLATRKLRSANPADIF